MSSVQTEETSDSSLESASDSGSSSSVHSNDVATNLNTSLQDDQLANIKNRKRKRSPSPDRAQKPRDPKMYSDYRQFLNDEIEELLSGSGNFESRFRPSQIGTATWTKHEKELFFRSLSRYGEDYRQISANLPEKSELEVTAFLRCLKQGHRESVMTGLTTREPDSSEAPAAVELSDACCIAIEDAAQDSINLQEKNNDLFERVWSPDFALLNRTEASWIEKHLDAEANLDDITGETSEFELLNLSNMLNLSERIFMNRWSKNMNEDNWYNLDTTQAGPAIFHSAFRDFYSIVLDLTKKLAQTSFFCMLSRTRLRRRTPTGTSLQILKQDVKAACSMLGVAANSHYFWVGAARRNHVQLCEHKRDADIGRGGLPLSYAEAERRLAFTNQREYEAKKELIRSAEDPYHDPESPGGNKGRIAHEQTSQGTSEQSSDQSRESSLDYQDVDDISDIPVTESGSSPVNGALGDLQSSQHDDLLAAHHAYLENIDARQSVQEEQRLWNVLHMSPPHELDASQFRRWPIPRGFPIPEERVLQWRDKLKYKSEWEVLTSPLPSSRSAQDLSLEPLERAENARVEDDIARSSSEPSDSAAIAVSRPRPRRTRSTPSVMPGMVPTASVLQESPIKGKMMREALMQDPFDGERASSEDRLYEST